jgi:hypothetical protein
LDFLEPRHSVDDAALADELHREACVGHLMHGIPVTALACRQDRDDVLFRRTDGSGRLAQIHLTRRLTPFVL